MLINNTGFGSFGVLETTPVEKVAEQFDVNVFGVMNTFAQCFRASGSAAKVPLSM